MIQKEKFSDYTLKTMGAWRGILAIFVFIAHIFQINIYPLIGSTGFIQDIISFIANISVVIFFLLSGILISYSGISLIKDNVFNWEKYLINRLTRIYPSYIVIIIISFLLVAIFSFLKNTTEIIWYGNEIFLARTTYTADPLDYILSLFMIPSGMYNINGPLWSLTVEWWIYISYMFFLLGLNWKGKIILYIISLIFLLIICRFNITNVTYILIWIIGAIYTHYLRHNPELFRKICLISLFLIFLYAIYFWFTGFFINENDWKVYSIIQILLSILSINFVTRLYIGKYMEFASNFSYTLYIIHFPVILFLFGVFHVYYSDSLYWVIITSVFYLFIIMITSYYISKITENKILFRKYFISK